MSSLFDHAAPDRVPLAERLRPQTLADVVGQDHLTEEGAPLSRMLETGDLQSLVLWGPPGTGKTTLARILARESGSAFEALSAISSGVGELRKVFARAKERPGTVLFIDEIHRFNRAQQDAFLPVMEDGTVVLIGATTENPSFELNGALLSRAQVFVLNALGEDAMAALLARAEQALGELPLTEDGRTALIDSSGGDGRYLLGLIESLSGETEALDASAVADRLRRRAAAYDKSGEAHYNLISALHKAMRGSDVDAALYWLARMIDGGEDPRYIARRVVRFASEDVGAADPLALLVAGEAARTYERLGSPEGELALAHAVVTCATAVKSNAVYAGWKAALQLAKQTGHVSPPAQSVNAPMQLMKDLGYGAGYQYDHNAGGGFSGQGHWPKDLDRARLYEPRGEGREAAILQRLERWRAAFEGSD
ncbi:MAG: replication-associated recombination protein A [Pseudomonadota bacterium]